MGLALLVGTIVIADLWTLGWNDRRPANLARWTAAGLALMLITGTALFFSNVPRYVHNSGFLVKMTLLAIALLAHFTVHRKGTRFAAVLSLALWSAVVISAKFIADLDA